MPDPGETITLLADNGSENGKKASAVSHSIPNAASPLPSANQPQQESPQLVSNIQSNTVHQQHQEATASNIQLGMWEVIRIAVIFCPIWFVANYTYNASLAHTSGTHRNCSLHACFFSAFNMIANFSERQTSGVCDACALYIHVCVL